MGEIQEKQYKNLRVCIKEYIINGILGENYYNIGQDVYTCDLYTMLDAKRKYDRAIRTANHYKRLCWLLTSLIFWLVILIIALIFTI